MTEQPENPAEPKLSPKRRIWPWVIAALAGLFVLIDLAMPAMSWDGRVKRPIRVRVTDNYSDVPIRGVDVSLMLQRDRGIWELLTPAERTEMLHRTNRLSTTDERGEAFLSGYFGAGGSDSLFGQSGMFIVDGMLKVSHPGYRTSENLLQNHLGKRRFSLRTKQLDVQIFLVPNPK